MKRMKRKKRMDGGTFLIYSWNSTSLEARKAVTSLSASSFAALSSVVFSVVL